MKIHDVLLYLAVFIAPYFFVLRFGAPFSLKISTERVSGFTAILCRLVWPMVIACGLLLAIAAFAFTHDLVVVSIVLVMCAGVFIGLLFVPGMTAFRQFYGWDRKR